MRIDNLFLKPAVMDSKLKNPYSSYENFVSCSALTRPHLNPLGNDTMSFVNDKLFILNSIVTSERFKGYTKVTYLYEFLSPDMNQNLWS